MRTVKIKSPANIAFIKYWGQRDSQFVLPYNDSFSMNLSDCYVLLEIESLENIGIKKLYIKNYQKENFEIAEKESMKKVINFYQQAKNFLKIKKEIGFIIKSQNSFPKKAGIASSAAFFSGLALGLTKLFNIDLDKKKLSILARLSGSGSACRSIPDGFSWWHKGKDSLSSFATSIAKPSYWQLVDLVLILSKKEKKTSSQEGHLKALTSPLFLPRIKHINDRIRRIKKAFFKKDFTSFGEILEEEAISMHSVMMTQKPPLYYWSKKTVEVIKEIVKLRQKGLESYFTIDAGENVHLICQKKDCDKFFNYFKNFPGIFDIIINSVCQGTRLLK